LCVPAMSASLRHRLRPQSGPTDHRSASVLLSCIRAFLKGCGHRPRIVGGDRPEHEVLPHGEGRSIDGGIAESRRRKTPLVLPYEGERRKGSGFAQPPEPGPLPHRGPQVILWRETERIFPRRGPSVTLWVETEKVFRREEGVGARRGCL